MLSGKVALGGLTLEFGNAQRRLDDLRTEVKALTRAHNKLLADEQNVIEELARTYLPELSQSAVSSGLVQLRAKMDEALAAQATHRRDLEERLAKLPEEVARRELLLAEAEGVEERAARGLDAVRATIELELEGDGRHSAEVAEHRATMERRSILGSRRARLQTIASVERHKYDENEAFAYLMRRRYGEPEYRGRLLFRWLDGWLARRIDYETLLRNYRILRTGPAAMHAETKQLTERAGSLERAIDGQEDEVGRRHGLMPALEAEVAAQASLVDAREALAEARARYDRLVAEIRAVDAHRGRPYEDALAQYRSFIQDREISDLVEIARSTPDPKDDELIRSLDTLRGRLEEVGDKLVALTERLEGEESRTTNLGDVARKALAHFSSRRSLFPDDFDLEDLVESIVEGDLSPGEAFRRISGSHVKRPLLVPSRSGDLDGWFAELSSQFDPELGAVSVRVDQSDIESEMVVYDQHGRVLQRRVTRRDAKHYRDRRDRDGRYDDDDDDDDDD